MLVVNLSGRGDKDMEQAQRLLELPHEPLRRDVRAAAGDARARSAPSSCSAIPISTTSAAILDALVEGGADMIEVGIPFSDPIADGPVIQAAAVRALASGRDAGRLLRPARRRSATAIRTCRSAS